ncbi:type II secretion system protein J [Clostridium sp. WILCCON 0269]|uniref:Type II secretion system protein J n=1 Tax=Candidatus Clostridium eludens TaxID=3381663 RepID=A0ABW8SIN8_9CLOT
MKKKGFTLVELMIALAIFTIFSVYLYQTFFSQIRQSFSFNNNIDIQYNVNKALSMITDEIRNYSFTNITIPTETEVMSGNKVIIDLDSNDLTHDIDYNKSSKTLNLNDVQSNANIDKCLNIDSVRISQGDSNNNESELILITVSASEGDIQITSSTAVNINR